MRVSMWRLATPIHTENRAVYETLITGKDGIVDIDINEYGLVVIDRGPNLPRLLVHGRSWGYEAERPKLSAPTVPQDDPVLKLAETAMKLGDPLVMPEVHRKGGLSVPTAAAKGKGAGQ